MIKKPLIVIIGFVLSLSFFVIIGRSCKNETNTKHYCNKSAIKSSNPIEHRHTDSELSPWPDSIYAAVKGVSYLNARECDVIVEYNKCRTNPKRYVEEVLQPFYDNLGSDGSYIINNQTYRLKEGRKVVNEAISFLKDVTPLPMLYPQQYLHKAAIIHCKDTGRKGLVGHEGTDGSSPTDRGKMFNRDCAGVAESISYGYRDAEQIMIQLLVDDDVPSRGHRKGVFLPYINTIGVAIRKHKHYKHMCVIDCSM